MCLCAFEGVCICVCACVCMCVCLYMHGVCVRVRVFVCVHAWFVCVCLCVYMSVDICLCVYVCVCECMCVCFYACILWYNYQTSVIRTSSQLLSINRANIACTYCIQVNIVELMPGKCFYGKYIHTKYLPIWKSTSYPSNQCPMGSAFPA